MITNPMFCTARATGRDLSLGVKPEISERVLNSLDVFSRSLENLASSVNDTDMLIFLATRSTCEQVDGIDEYDPNHPSIWALNMGSTTEVCLIGRVCVCLRALCVPIRGCFLRFSMHLVCFVRSL